MHAGTSSTGSDRPLSSSGIRCANNPELPPSVQEHLTKRIKKGQIELPILDHSTAKIISICNDPEAEIEQLINLLTQDQHLAAHLLRIANTTAYATREPIVSLNQAVGRLGMTKIREIALVIAMQNSQFQLPAFIEDINNTLDLGLAGALFGQEIARSRRWNVEEHFLCGLLRNIGIPVSLQVLCECYDELAVPRDDQQALLAIRSTTACIHPHLGSALVTQWKLPERVGEVIRYVSQPSQAPTAAGLAHATQLADAMATWMLAGSGEREALHKHESLEALNLYPDELDDILNQHDQVRSAMESMRL